MQKLNKAVNEGSTLVATISFMDEKGLVVTPLTTRWSLYDAAGEIVNGKNNVSTTPAAAVNIVLTGPDLVVAEGKTFEKMTLVVHATYNSNRGLGLNMTESLVFQVNKLRT